MLPKTRTIAAAVSFAAFSLAAGAQVDRSAITGTVIDDAGKAVPGVRIFAIDPATGLHRDSVSTTDGRYELPQLPVGTYELSFTRQGFAAVTYTGLEQTVGRTRTLDAVMRVAGASETVQVTDAGSDLNRNSDALGARLERKQVDELPINGRNWTNLTTLVPGAVDAGGSNQRSIRFAGRGLDDNNFTYDGIDATNIVNQAQQPFVRLAIPTSSIEEFRVDTALFTAESGSTSGGQVAVVSRAGSNAFHGSLFYFARNSVFDAREPIDNVNPAKPSFSLNQYGGSIGGPIRRDKSFFFVNYEGFRQSLGQTLIGRVPSAAYRAQTLAANPALAPVLAAYPVSTNVIAGSNGLIAQFNGVGQQTDNEDSAMLRLDHRFSAKDTADLRFNFDAARSRLPLAGGGTYLLDRQEVNSRPVNGVLEYLHLFSPAWVNDAKFGFNRGNVYTTNLAALNLPYSVAVSGLTTLNNNRYSLGVGNSFSYIDQLTWVHGAHALKLGGEVRRIQLNQGNTANGAIGFTRAGFAANAVSSANYASELPINGLRKTYVLAYAQDEWKATPTLTANLGVRYSFFNRFNEVEGRAIPFDFLSCGPGGYCGAGAEFSRPRLLDVDPRLALTWAPGRLGGRTVLRGGFGIYHGDGQLDDQNLPISNEVGRFSYNGIRNLSFPIDPFLPQATPVLSPRYMNRDRHDEYVTQYGFSAQQAVGKGWVGTLSYAGAKGSKLLRTSYVNLLDPATGTRQYAGFNQVEYRGNDNSSSYNAFVAELRRTFASGLLFQANYTYAHAIDQDAAGGGDSDFPQDPANFAAERASGDFDVRHVFNSNLVYELPYGRGKAFGNGGGVVSAVLGNWQASNIVTARGGLPVNVTIDRPSTFSAANPTGVATGYTTNQRPNRVPGVALTPQTGAGIANWINPAAFAPVTGGGYGNAGRNLLRGPGLWQTDLGLAKNIPIREQAQLQFRAEFFNLFNRAQYGLPAADLSGGPGVFGVITTPVNTSPVGTGTPREMQFALRLDY